MKKRPLALSFGILSAMSAVAQDSLQYRGKAGVADVADSDPGLFIMMMIFAVGCLAVFLIGLVVAGIAIAAAAALMASGIFSVSVFVGFYKRSFFSGARTALILGGAVAGGLFGCVAYYALGWLRKWHIGIHLDRAAVACIAGGILGGVLLAFATSAILKGLYRWAMRRLSQTNRA